MSRYSIQKKRKFSKFTLKLKMKAAVLIILMNVFLVGCVHEKRNKEIKNEIFLTEKAFEKMSSEKSIPEAFYYYADENAVIKRENDNFRLFTAGHHLPRNDVGMVLHFGDDDLVPVLYKGFTKGKSHQVDAFGGPFCENNLFPVSGMYKMLNLVPDRLKSFSGFIGHKMGSPVDIPVKIKGQPAFSQQNPHIFLCGSCTVEIYQRFSIDLVSQNGKLLADFGNIKGHDSAFKGQQSQ